MPKCIATKRDIFPQMCKQYAQLTEFSPMLGHDGPDPHMIQEFSKTVTYGINLKTVRFVACF